METDSGCSTRSMNSMVQPRRASPASPSRRATAWRCRELRPARGDEPTSVASAAPITAAIHFAESRTCLVQCGTEDEPASAVHGALTFSCRIDLQASERAVGMETFMVPAGRGHRLKVRLFLAVAPQQPLPITE